MAVKLSLAGRPPLTVDEEYISLGSDPGCSIVLPDLPHVKKKHAVIQLVTGRWLIEVRQAESIYVGGSEAKQMHWLDSGDIIQLSDLGPIVRFEVLDREAGPVERAPSKSAAPATPAPAQQKTAEQKSAVIKTTEPKSTAPLLSSDDCRLLLATDDDHTGSRRVSDPIIPLTTSASAAPAAKPATPAPAGRKKSPSSSIIPTVKASPLTAESPLPPSTVTIAAQKSTTSRAIKTISTLSSVEIPQAGVAPSSKSAIPKASPSTTIRTPKPSASEIRVPLSDDAIPTSQSSMKTSRSSSGKKSGSQASIPSRNPDNEPDARLPVLKRITTREVPTLEAADVDDWSESAPRQRGRLGDDAEIRFIKSVVIRCAVAVLGIIILWQGCRELFKALSGPQMDAPATTSIVLRDSDRC